MLHKLFPPVNLLEQKVASNWWNQWELLKKNTYEGKGGVPLRILTTS